MSSKKKRKSKTKKKITAKEDPKPSGYGKVSGSSQTVSSKRHDPLSATNCKPEGQLSSLSADSDGSAGGGAMSGKQLSSDTDASSDAAGGKADETRLEANGDGEIALFIYYLPETVDHAELFKLFEPFKATKANVVRHETGRSKGFGFVHFDALEDAQKAIDAMDGHQIGRKRLRVTMKGMEHDEAAQKKKWKERKAMLRKKEMEHNEGAQRESAGEAISGKQYSLFVFYLPEDISSDGLLELFAPHGAMRSNVMRHETGRSRGFGFVHFNTRHEAQIAIDMMNGHQIGRKRLRVSFKKEH